MPNIFDTVKKIVPNDKTIIDLNEEIEKVLEENKRVKEQWRKYRYALNQIANPNSYKRKEGVSDMDIAREALKL